MIKICFVCTGNTCRSVMAERLMKKRIKVGGVKDIKVCSKGLQANGENIAENAKKALKKFGASAANRKSVKLGKIDSKIIYVTMTEAQKKQIDSKNVMSMKDLLGFEIADPYGGDEKQYCSCCDSLNIATGMLLEKIVNGRKRV